MSATKTYIKVSRLLGAYLLRENETVSINIFGIIKHNTIVRKDQMLAQVQRDIRSRSESGGPIGTIATWCRSLSRPRPPIAKWGKIPGKLQSAAIALKEAKDGNEFQPNVFGQYHTND